MSGWNNDIRGEAETLDCGLSSYPSLLLVQEKWQISRSAGEPSSQKTYCRTATISQRAAKAHQEKTQSDREATNKDRGKREWALEADMWKKRRRECTEESRDWLPLIFTISGADKRRACLCSDTNCPWKVTRGEAEALSSDRPRSATSALITRDTRQPSRHTGHQPHQLNSRNPSREGQTEGRNRPRVREGIEDQHWEGNGNGARGQGEKTKMES